MLQLPHKGRDYTSLLIERQDEDLDIDMVRKSIISLIKRSDRLAWRYYDT